MHFTRPRELLIAGAIGIAIAYLGFTVAYESIPHLPTPAGVTLLVLAIAEFTFAFALRSRIRSGQLLGAITAARAVQLAKASSLLGALMGGAWLGVLGYVFPQASYLTAAAADLPSSVIGVVCSIALIGAALWLEQCCRTPKRRDSDRDPDGTG